MELGFKKLEGAFWSARRLSFFFAGSMRIATRNMVGTIEIGETQSDAFKKNVLPSVLWATCT